MAKKTHQLSARCEKDLFDALSEQAEEANMARPDYIRYVCREILSADRAEKLKTKALNAETERDKFKEKYENAELAITRLKSVLRQFAQRGFFARLFNRKPNLQGIDLSD